MNKCSSCWAFFLMPLLLAPAPIFAAGGAGQALEQAFEHRDLAAVRAALDAGADPSSADGFQPLLVGAAHDSQFQIADLLLDRGASPNAADGNGQTALTSLADDVPLALVRKLLDHGADANGNPKASSTPLGSFAWSSRLDLVRLVILRGAGVNVRRGGGMTPLMEAAQRTRRVDVLRFLLDHGADVKARDAQGETALFSACSVPDNGPVLRFLLDKGLDVNDKAPFSTPLQGAAASGSLENVRLLLARGADVNAAATLEGTTALMAAAGGDRTTALTAAGQSRPDPVRLDLVRLLLARGADACVVTPDGTSALGRAAAARADPALLQLLLDHGARVNQPPALTPGPLASAACACRTDNVRWLLAHGADARAADRSGKTPLMYAREGRGAGDQSGASESTPARQRIRAGIVTLLTNAGALK